ncbi:Endonuclease MutS2 [Aquisphaera giovannonii]|uniref:Endonuclease MutS2 n=1 Tax=Aquisphaera giovannonii TaxID=406548 RepID=A0A5B9WAQ0_9BACT|nr:DNA strand exchange inhibitor protein [Aquisphaera giovannonii]QEH37101.1 Endonuclease MutS2 [Aquisphaera giovannonii]
MDSHTLDLLEFDRIRLLLASRAACSLGKEAARGLAPMVDPGSIHEELALTTEMVEAIRSRITPPLGGLHDIRPHVQRAQVGAMLEPEELAEVAETLRAIGYLDQWLVRVGDQFPRLGGLRHGVGEFSGVATTIDGCLDSRAKILDTASRRLSALRREIGQAEERIQDTLRRMLRSPEIKRYLRYPNFTMVGHHYVLPISKEHRGEVQGSVQRTSATNETVYIEPAAISEQSAQLSYLRSREAKEIRRVLRWLSAQVGHVADSLLDTLRILAHLDLIHARARLSYDYEMVAPDMNLEGRLVLRQARHPLLEAIFRKDPALEASAQVDRPPATPPDSPPADAVTSAGPGLDPPPGLPATSRRTVVPVDVHLGVRFRTLVVTGPNTGGKTVALKTVGLLAAMAQSGLHIPAAEGSQLPVFDDVLADIGDEQSLEQSLSTFSSHVRRISQVLSKSTERSLVLLDELGAGTDPAEGAALGWAILDEIDSIGCDAIVTTHIGELKSYAMSNGRAENAAVEFDVETLQPRYRLHIGDVGQSNALRIARRLGLPEHIVGRAEGYQEKHQGSSSAPEWELIQKLRKEAEDARQAALAAQAEAERTREALAQRLADLQREAEREESIADARARLQQGDRVVVPRLGYDRPGRIVKLDPRKKTATVAIGHVTWDVAIDELIPQAARTPDEASRNPAAPPRGGRPKVFRSLDEFE